LDAWQCLFGGQCACFPYIILYAPARGGRKKISDIDVFCLFVRSAAGLAQVQAARQASIMLFRRGIGSICSECLAAILVGTAVASSIGAQCRLLRCERFRAGASRAVQDLIDSNPWLQTLVLSRVANRKTVSIPDRVEAMLLLDTL
jgi:hypothetical protein